jgi:hypothetical protein
LCFVNVEQLKKIKIGSEHDIKLHGSTFDSDNNTLQRIYLVNGQQVNFIQNNYSSCYSIEEEIQLIRKNIKATNNGIVFIKH